MMPAEEMLTGNRSINGELLFFGSLQDNTGLGPNCIYVYCFKQQRQQQQNYILFSGSLNSLLRTPVKQHYWS